MEESMNDFRELAWLAMKVKVVVADEFPPPIERRVLTFGFLDRSTRLTHDSGRQKTKLEKKGEVEKQEDEKFGSHC
ncbi:hypothetical protein V6N13_093373 [Hibiscus sabdariffa]